MDNIGIHSQSGTHFDRNLSAKAMTSETGSVPGDRMKINGVVFTSVQKSGFNMF